MRLLRAVMLDVSLRGFTRVMLCMLMVPVRRVRMMSSLLVLAGFMVLGRLIVVPSGMLVVFRRLAMMIRCLFRHVPSSPRPQATRMP
jgi:hypothetical protein